MPRSPFSWLCQLGLDVLAKVPNVDLVLNSMNFVLISHQCLDSGKPVCDHDFYGDSTP